MAGYENFFQTSRSEPRYSACRGSNQGPTPSRVTRAMKPFLWVLSRRATREEKRRKMTHFQQNALRAPISVQPLMMTGRANSVRYTLALLLTPTNLFPLPAIPALFCCISPLP